MKFGKTTSKTVPTAKHISISQEKLNKQIHKHSKALVSSRNDDKSKANMSSSEYFKLIVDFVLREDKFRCKLLKLALNRSAVEFETAFPKRNDSERFDYIASGSYAQVYRHEVKKEIVKKNDTSKNMPKSDRPPVDKISAPKPFDESMSSISPPITILKLIDVFSECLLKNLLGVSSRSSVSTYRDAYNEFKISIILSYLNTGVRRGNGKYYSCPIFPIIYRCYVVNNSMPNYFENSSELKRIDYEKLIANEGRADGTAPDNLLLEDNGKAVVGENHNNNNNQCVLNNGGADEAPTAQPMMRSRPTMKELQLIKPEIAAIRMEDCGEPIIDLLKKFKPYEILSLVKQILLGFLVAEDAFEFEHRDLHMGNILVKSTSQQYLSFMYINKTFTLPCYRLQVKVIDTTFSRLKLRNRVFYRDLNHLFDDKEMENEAGENNRLSHQDQTYQAMASEIKRNWIKHYPRTNLYWCVYIIKKFLRHRVLRKDNSREANQVRLMLNMYANLLFRVRNMNAFFTEIYQKSELNRYVPITINPN